MTHARRPDPPAKYCGDVGICPACGKKSYRTKKIAKNSGLQLYPGQRMRVYPCDGSPYWHLTSKSALRAAAWKDWLAS